MTFKKHKKQIFSIMLFNNGLTFFTTNKWGHKTKGLKPRVQIKKSILPKKKSYFLNNEILNFKTLIKKI
jgi:hypothetical protein